MTRQHGIIPHGSGPLTVRGRRALWRQLEPLLPDFCHSLSLGSFSHARRIEHGRHHIVWQVWTSRGCFAIRPGARRGRDGNASHKSREQLWTKVGSLLVAPKYRGSKELRLAGFDGWIEAFDWIESRHLIPTKEYTGVAQTLARLHIRCVSAGMQALPKVEMLSFLRTGLARYHRRNRGGGATADLLREETRETLRSLQDRRASPVRPCLVHNDLVDANVLFGEGRIWLIDWDWAMLGSPSIDLFGFLSPFVRSWGKGPCSLSSQQASRFLSTYATERGDSATMRVLREEACYWKPHNVLLANWLYHEASGRPRTTSLSFYTEAFEYVERLTRPISSFK